MKQLVRWVTAFLFVLVTLSGVGGTLLAAEDAQISSYENVTIWVYPEYDDSRLLVMMEGDIAGTSAPAEVSFLVPTDAQMYSAGSKDAQGQYSGGPPNREASGTPGWDIISYEVTEQTFRVEYYTAQIIGYPDKSIDFKYSFLFPVTGLEVIFQEPRESSEYLISPAGNAFTDSEGFRSHLFTYTTLPTGQSLEYSVTYTKSDNRPSLDISPSGSSDALTAVIVIVALTLGVGAFLFLMNRAGKKPAGRAARRRAQKSETRKNAKPATEPRGESTTRPRFCSYCGKPLKGSGAYCAFCGEATGKNDGQG